MWNGEVSFGASLPGCAHQVKDQPSLGRNRLADLPDLRFQGRERNNPIQKSVELMSFQNQPEMSKEHIRQLPLYLTVHGHLFLHVGPGTQCQPSELHGAHHPEGKRWEWGPGSGAEGSRGRADKDSQGLDSGDQYEAWI